GRGPSCSRSPADLAHGLRRLLESLLVDQVTLFLLPDRALDHPSQVVVRGAAPHQVAKRRLAQREQARPQAALGGEPDAVAGRAEGLRNRGDEAEPAAAAVG